MAGKHSFKADYELFRTMVEASALIQGPGQMDKDIERSFQVAQKVFDLIQVEKMSNGESICLILHLIASMCEEVRAAEVASRGTRTLRDYGVKTEVCDPATGRWKPGEGD